MDKRQSPNPWMLKRSQGTGLRMTLQEGQPRKARCGGHGVGADRGGPEEVGGMGLSSCHVRTPGSCGGKAHLPR